MSLANERNVSKIVQKYHAELPEVERPLLRRLIIDENKGLNTRTLDRHLKKLFEQKEEQHSNPEKLPKLSPEEQARLDRGLTEFRTKYQDRFDKITKTYISSREKAWKELFEFASTWPEPAVSRFLWRVRRYDPNEHERDRRLGIQDHAYEADYFVSVMAASKLDVWKAVLNSDRPQIH